MSKLTVIIPTLIEKDGSYMKLCVESLRGSGFDGDIIVVANGTRDMAPFRKLDIRGITKANVTRHQGQCYAVNRGVEQVEGDCQWILVSNADMYYAPDWATNLPDLDDPKTPLCFSPNLVEPSDNRGSAPPFLKYNGGLDLEHFKRPEINKFISTTQKHSKGYEDGFNLPFFIRLDVWRTIGGYDEKYDPWGSNSDTDLQTKINLAGITPKRKRNMLVYHFSEKSGTFDRDNTEKDQAWWNNWHYYNEKWGFNRDDLKSDVWYNKHVLPTEEDEQEIKYQPGWARKYV